MEYAGLQCIQMSTLQESLKWTLQERLEEFNVSTCEHVATWFSKMALFSAFRPQQVRLVISEILTISQRKSRYKPRKNPNFHQLVWNRSLRFHPPAQIKPLNDDFSCLWYGSNAILSKCWSKFSITVQQIVEQPWTSSCQQGNIKCTEMQLTLPAWIFLDIIWQSSRDVWNSKFSASIFEIKIWWNDWCW